MTTFLLIGFNEESCNGLTELLSRPLRKKETECPIRRELHKMIQQIPSQIMSQCDSEKISMQNLISHYGRLADDDPIIWRMYDTNEYHCYCCCDKLIEYDGKYTYTDLSLFFAVVTTSICKLLDHKFGDNHINSDDHLLNVLYQSSLEKSVQYKQRKRNRRRLAKMIKRNKK